MNNNSSYIDISERKLLLRLLDIILIITGVFLASDYTSFSYIDSYNSSIISWLALLGFYFLFFGEVFQLYDLKISASRYKIIKNLFLASLITTFVFVLTPFYSPSLPENRMQIIYLFLLLILPVLCWRLAYISLLFSPKFFKEIIIISHSSTINELLELTKDDHHHNVGKYLSNNKNAGFENFVNIKEANIYEIVRKNNIKEVIINTSGFSTEIIKKINRDLILLFEEGINIKSSESFYEEITASVPKNYLDFNFYKNMNFSCSSNKRFYKLFHRFLDIVISLTGLLLFLVLLPFIFILNVFMNKGPLFYKQIRVGKNGQNFTIFKLRSMVVNAESSGAVYAQKNDTRITKFGKFLRKTRLDEVPQFFNILKGDMSIIGPRPERPKFVKDLEEKVPFYAIRHVVKPGLTGWAQVKFPYAGTLEEQEKKLRYDLFYIKEQCILLDFKIIIRTITTVLFFKGQ